MQANLIKSSAARENQLKDVWIGAEAYVIDRLLRSQRQKQQSSRFIEGRLRIIDSLIDVIYAENEIIKAWRGR